MSLKARQNHADTSKREPSNSESMKNKHNQEPPSTMQAASCIVNQLSTRSSVSNMMPIKEESAIIEEHSEEYSGQHGLVTAESHKESELQNRRSSLPAAANMESMYTFYHYNRRVGVFGSQTIQLLKNDREYSLRYSGDEDPEKEQCDDDNSHLWDDLVNQIAQLDNPSRKLKAGSVGFEMQKQRESFQPNNSLNTHCDLGRCLPFLRQPKKSKDLQFAEKAGLKMMPNFFFPAVPKVLEDFWVALELIVVLFDFIFNCVVYSGLPLDTLVVSFSVFAVFLSLLDTLLYFSTESSCKRCLKKYRKSNPHPSTAPNSKSCSGCVKLSDSFSKKLGIWTQIIRTLISELILFPLTLADLVELIELQTYSQSDVENRINFGLFFVGIFFLVLTVYFMRIFMALSSIVNVKRLSKTTSNDPSSLIIKFCVHLIAQIVMHATIFIMISSKLHQETCRVDLTNIQNASNISVTISPFLWYQIGSGAFIPLIGTALFFLLNYPAIKQLSVTMYIDIMTTVVNESFADLIFQGEGLKTAKKKASKVAEKANVQTTRSDFEQYKKHFSIKSNLQYQLSSPLVIVCSLIYGYAFIGFFVSHCFGYKDPCDTGGGFNFLLINDTFVTITFFGGILVAVVANYQILIAITSLMVLGLIAILFFPVLFTFLVMSCLIWTVKRCANH